MIPSDCSYPAIGIHCLGYARGGKSWGWAAGHLSQSILNVIFPPFSTITEPKLAVGSALSTCIFFFFFTWFFVDLSCSLMVWTRSIEINQWIHLSIERPRRSSSSLVLAFEDCWWWSLLDQFLWIPVQPLKTQEEAWDEGNSRFTKPNLWTYSLTYRLGCIALLSCYYLVTRLKFLIMVTFILMCISCEC